MLAIARSIGMMRNSSLCEKPKPMFAMNGSEVLGLNRFFVVSVSWAGNLPQKTLRQVLFDSLRRGVLTGGSGRWRVYNGVKAIDSTGSRCGLRFISLERLFRGSISEES